MSTPVLKPSTLLALMRSCVREDGSVWREDELRGYLPDVDACLESLRRADGHRNKDELEAA